MVRPPRHRPPHVAQGTWRSGSLHVWGWNGIDTASMAWLYSGFRKLADDGTRTGWHDSPISYGTIGRISIEVPGRPMMPAPSVQLDPHGTAVWLSELPPDEYLSDSLAWFARLAELSRRVVSAGLVAPVIVNEGPFTVGRWVPVTGADASPEVEATLDALEASKPFICTAGSSHDTRRIHAQLVDGIARTQLYSTGWKAELGRGRKPAVQVLRATFGALAKPDHVIRGGTDEFAGALERLRSELDRHRRRLDGEPVVMPRLRLLIPDDPHNDWEVRIELVDDTDSMRWCTANDVWERNEQALDVARGEQHLERLAEQIGETVMRVSAVIPALADLAFEHEPTGIDLDIAQAEDFIEVAPFELDRLGIDLLGPERLVRSRARVSGEATPAPSDDRKMKFGREALVEWRLVVGGEEISDAELARAEEAGATLLHTGHRWVRIDADELRRKRDKLRDLEETKSRVTPLELLALANDDEATDERPTIIVHEAGALVDGVEVGSGYDGADGVTAPDAAAIVDGDWVRNLLEGLPDEQLTESTEAAEFTGELRHYQRRGLGWMQFLSRLGLGGCLADDMGLGKTATTLAHLLERPGPHLVVCPLSVVRNWRAEAERFTPKLDVVVHHGANRTRIFESVARALREPDPSGSEENGSGSASDESFAAELFAVDPEQQLVVTTYGLLPRDLELLGDITWSTLVLDEAQMIKNPNTKAARAVRQLHAAQKIALTGTPVENRLSELWAILDAVNPGMLGGLERFRRDFASPIERNHDDDAAARLRRITGPFVLRRTKADKRLLPDLPDKIEQIAYATLTQEQATLYQQVVDQLLEEAQESSGMRRRGIVLAALMRLKQICNHPAHALKDGSRLAGRSGKLARFDELVTDLLDADERALVFTQFREMGDLLAQHVAEQFHFDAPFLHGGVTRTRRDDMVDRYQDGAGPPLLIVSLKAGGTGLNLTAASQVIHYDRWWNPAVEDQATDRAWRIGQTRTVNVHKLVCEGTVEEKVSEVIDDKRKLAEQVVGADDKDVWISELSTDELRDLVTLELDP